MKKKIDKDKLINIIVYDVLPVLFMIGTLALVIGAFCCYTK